MMTSDASDAPSGSRSSDSPSFGEPGAFDPSADSSSDAMGDAPPSFGSAQSTSFDAERDTSFGSASMMQDVAAMYVREHQTASMLGAFAVGVFVGALLRD